MRIVTFRMNLKNPGRTRRHRGIDVNRHFGNAFFIDEQMKIIDQLLRALYRKGRNNHLALQGDRPAHNLFQFVHRRIRILVPAVTVGAFQKKIIDCGNVRVRVAYNRLVFAPQVSRVRNADFPVIRPASVKRASAFARNRNDRHRRAQNMSRVKKLKPNVACNMHFAPVRKRDKLIRRAHHILFAEQGLPRKAFFFLLRLLAQIVGIPRLNARTVHHNEARQIARSRRRINVSVKTFFYQQR